MIPSSDVHAVRVALAQDPSLGCGNFLDFACARAKRPNDPLIFLDEAYVARSGERFEALSLAALDRLADAEAAAYHAAGVRRCDPVAVSVEDGVGYLIHFVALARLGAIAVLVNPKMPP